MNAPAPVVQADINKQVGAARSSSRRKIPTLLLVALVTLALAGTAFAAAYIYKTFVEPSLNASSPAATEQNANETVNAEDEYEYVWAVSQATVSRYYREDFTAQYAYDDAGRLASIEFGESGPFGFTSDKAFTYNEDGSIAAITSDYANYDSGGGTTTGSSESQSYSYAYNDDGTIASISQGVGNTASPYITYAYSNGVPVGSTCSDSSAGSVFRDVTTDEDGNIDSLTLSASNAGGGIEDSFSRDASGNITSASGYHDADYVTTTFEYDNYGNLVKVTYPSSGGGQDVVYEFTYEIHKVKKGSYIPTVYSNPTAYAYDTMEHLLAQFEWLSVSDIDRILAAPRDSEVVDYTKD